MILNEVPDNLTIEEVVIFFKVCDQRYRASHSKDLVHLMQIVKELYQVTDSIDIMENYCEDIKRYLQKETEDILTKLHKRSEARNTKHINNLVHFCNTGKFID